MGISNLSIFENGHVNILVKWFIISLSQVDAFERSKLFVTTRIYIHLYKRTVPFIIVAGGWAGR